MRLRAGESPGGARAAAVGLRSRPAVAVGALLLLAVAGCATARTAAAPCVPPGMPPVAEWRALGAQPVVLEGAAGVPPTFGVVVDYAVGALGADGRMTGRAPTCDWVEDSGRRA